jgi:ABC-type glutathione transport system ATPase component
MARMETYIQAKYLRIYRGSELLLDAQNLNFPEQAVTALVGPSGSGKTLTAYAMLNLLKIAAPSLWAETDIRFPSRKGAFRTSYVPQGTGFHLQPTVSVRSQIRNLVCGKGGLQPELYSDQESLSLLHSLRVGSLDEILELTPAELSGGMLQRVLVAIAILRRPHFMVLDEPTTSLDSYARASAYKAILDCCTRHGSAILLLSHNPRDVSVLADHVLSIEGGVIGPGPHPKTFRDKIPNPDGYLHSKFSGSTTWKTEGLTVSLKPRRLRSLFSFRGEKTVRKAFSIDPFSIQLRSSDCLGLIGESGCGKTTLLLAMACLVSRDSGVIALESEDITTLSARRVRRLRRHFQVVFQDASKSLNPSCSVEGILREPSLIHGEPSPKMAALRDALFTVHLPPNILDRQITELSYGQRQRLALLRVLMSFPHLKVLLLDEPFTGLDPVAVQAVIDLWQDQAERLVTIIASHDIEWIQGLCNHVHVMRDGTHVETCSRPNRLFQTEYARQFWQAGLVADRSSLIEFGD